MTVASQGESTFGVTKLASSQLTVVAVSGPSPQPLRSGTEEIAACGCITWPGSSALPYVGRVLAGRPFAKASIACATQALPHGGRAEMRLNTTERRHACAFSPLLWSS